MAIIQPSTRTSNEWTVGAPDDFISSGGAPDWSPPDEYDPQRETYEFTLGSGDSSPLFNTRGSHLIIAVAQGAAKWEVSNIDSTRVREHSIAGLATNPTGSVVGIISCQVIPDSVRLTDTSGGSNEITLYIYR